MAQFETRPAPYLEFKYKRNVSIDLGDDRQYAIPSESREVPTPWSKEIPLIRPDGSIEREKVNYAVQHVYNLDKIHKVELRDEEPRIPVKPEHMSKEYHQKLVDSAYETALENKKFNDEVRRRIRGYVLKGDIEVVNDPFAVVTRADSDRKTKPIKTSEESETA